MLLRNQHTGMTEQTRNLLQGHARKEVLDSKRVPQHVKVGRPGAAVSLQKELGCVSVALSSIFPKILIQFETSLLRLLRPLQKK